jgi:uncharacterized protein (DUF2235 family)
MKRLIICADGTWNERDQVDEKTHLRHATNVTKVARAISSRDPSDIDQVVFYHDGVGTHPGLDKITGGAFGEGIEGNIRDLYRFLVYNYVAGDEIFMFGFSRGAFTVRTLAGFMDTFGLLDKADDFYVPDLYAEYQRGDSAELILSDPHFRRMKPPSRCPPIKFLGVWDTVGALGLPGKVGEILTSKATSYHNVALHPSIENAYHALAIDEQRVPFRPTLWTRPAGWQGTLEQAWFAGVHSNVGGGYSPDGLANEALHWMVDRAEQHGLQIESEYLEFFKPCFNSTLNVSMTWAYRVFGKNIRALGQHREDGECIHRSVIDRLNHMPGEYSPSNVLPELLEKDGPKALPISETRQSRISRGEPCGAQPDNVHH